MKKTIRRFTLVEMLTVVAIIGILAGLIIPTVIIAQNRGRETQAKSDISSIMTALKQLKSDYNRCLVKTSSGDFYVGGVKAADHSVVSKFKCNQHNSTSTDSDDPEHIVVRVTGTAYDAMIAELSAPKNTTLLGLSDDNKKLCVNRRRKTYLDPQNGFNPAAGYNTTANLEKLWRDPWGNPYVIYIGVDADHRLQMDDYNSASVAAGFAVYSFGPNGTDDGGCNSSLESCISNINDNGAANHKNHDDFASWNL